MIKLVSMSKPVWNQSIICGILIWIIFEGFWKFETGWTFFTSLFSASGDRWLPHPWWPHWWPQGGGHQRSPEKKKNNMPLGWGCLSDVIKDRSLRERSFITKGGEAVRISISEIQFFFKKITNFFFEKRFWVRKRSQRVKKISPESSWVVLKFFKIFFFPQHIFTCWRSIFPPNCPQKHQICPVWPYEVVIWKKSPTWFFSISVSGSLGCPWGFKNYFWKGFE